MSRTYPIQNKRGWMRKKAKKYPYRIKNDGGVRVWTTTLEREPLTGAPEVKIEPMHAGFVLRNSIYVTDGRWTRKKP